MTQKRLPQKNLFGGRMCAFLQVEGLAREPAKDPEELKAHIRVIVLRA